MAMGTVKWFNATKGASSGPTTAARTFLCTFLQCKKLVTMDWPRVPRSATRLFQIGARNRPKIYASAKPNIRKNERPNIRLRSGELGIMFTVRRGAQRPSVVSRSEPRSAALAGFVH